MIDASRQTALFYAARCGHLTVCQWLITNGGCEVDLSDLAGQTPLFYACSFKQAQMVPFLIQAGADYDRTDNEGRTPLMWAASNTSLPCVKALIRAGCDITIRDTVQRPDGSKWMASDWAAQYNAGQCAKFLKEKLKKMKAAEVAARRKEESAAKRAAVTANAYVPPASQVRMVVSVWVFRPEKLKSSPGRSVIGRGKRKRFGSPCSASFATSGPPG